MTKPAAKQGDMITAIDTHILLVPSPGGPVPTPTPLPFNGMLNGNLSSNVKIMGMPAATVGSTADNIPPHICPPPATFQKPPSNKGTVQMGSMTVKINGKQAARMGDICMTCNDPVDAPVGQVVVPFSTVMIGG
jgi:uncharacterized Zn-binding protein involved in type VI secretion